MTNPVPETNCLKKFNQAEWAQKYAEYKDWKISGSKGELFDLTFCDFKDISINPEPKNLSRINFSGSEFNETSFKNVKEFAYVDFSKSRFNGLTIKSKKFTECDFTGAFLQNVKIEETEFKKTKFDEANLEGGTLENLKFEESSFVKSNFRNADLSFSNFLPQTVNQVGETTEAQPSNLENALFQNAKLRETNLRKANLKNAEFNDADLTDAKLEEIDASEAVFINATLVKASFVGANLKKTNFNNSNLTGANFTSDNPITATNLIDAELKNATISHAQFLGADLTNANLQNAIAHGTNFSSSITARTNFGGSDLTNASLPSEDFFQRNIGTIEESSKIARILYPWLLGILAFSLLTIFSTQDEQLIGNSTTTPLPIIQTAISIAVFYIFAPILIFVLYFYIHSQLQHQWRLISKLPAVFEDGTPLHDVQFPWLLNTRTRNFFPNVKLSELKLHSLHSTIRICLEVFLAWYSTPLILFGFWLGYLPNHEAGGSYFQIFWFILTISISIIFYNSSNTTLKNLPFPWIKTVVIAIFLIIPSLALTIWISNFAVSGDISIVGKWSRVKTPIGEINLPIRNFLRANFEEKDVSFRSPNWDIKNPLLGVKAANLSGKNLRYANGYKAFLAGAKFIGSDLTGAHLNDAILIKADLTNANLYKAKLWGAKLNSANLIDANLNQAYLSEADFENSILVGASFNNAELFGANFNGADLTGVDFTGAKSLTVEQITPSLNWKEALFDNPLRKNLEITDEMVKDTLSIILATKYPEKSETELQKLLKERLKSDYQIELSSSDKSQPENEI